MLESFFKNDPHSSKIRDLIPVDRTGFSFNKKNEFYQGKP